MGCGTAPCVVAGVRRMGNGDRLFNFSGSGEGLVGWWVWCVGGSRMSLLGCWHRGGGTAAGVRGGEDLQQVCFGCLGEEERRT